MWLIKTEAARQTSKGRVQAQDPPASSSEAHELTIHLHPTSIHPQVKHSFTPPMAIPPLKAGQE